MKSLSRVRPSATPWTAAYQPPPSVEFSRQEYWSGVPLPSPQVWGRRPQKMSLTCPHTPMFTEALFMIAKKWKSPRYPLTDDWINHMWSIHTIEYYLTFKRREILAQAVTQRSLVNIVLGEINQVWKDRCCLIPLIRGP